MNLFDRLENYKKLDYEYAGVLLTALNIIGEYKLELLLNEAEVLGKKIVLTYPIPFEYGPSEPDGVNLL